MYAHTNMTYSRGRTVSIACRAYRLLTLLLTPSNLMGSDAGKVLGIEFSETQIDLHFSRRSRDAASLYHKAACACINPHFVSCVLIRS